MKHPIFLLLVLCLGPIAAAQSLPTSFEPGRRNPQTDEITGASPNVRWAVRIGSPTYATPVIANGKVLIGTLNDARWDERRGGGRSVLLCFDEKTGKFLWQLALPKDYRIPYFDSYCVGISSTPTVVGDRAFLTTGRGEVLCLDLNGMADGNDGPYRNEAELYAFRDNPREKPINILPLDDRDADIVWRYDAFGELKAKPHDTNNCNIVHYDGLLVVNTGNSPDYSHVHVPNPEAPALIIMDAERGIPLARDDFDIGSDISHGHWCSPGFARINGQDWIFYGGGNAHLYAVKAPTKTELYKMHAEHMKKGRQKPGNELPRLKTAWKFEGDPRAQPGSKEKVPPYVMGIGSPSYTCLPPPEFDDPNNARRIYMMFGHDAWNGAKPFRSWLACIDAVTGSQKAIWGTGNIEGGAVAPPVFDEGLLYMADRRGNFYVFDAMTGKELSKLPLKGDIWARPLIADGKIYVGTDRRLFYTLSKGRAPKILSEVQMPDRIFAPAAAANGTLYIVGDGFLYAVSDGT